MSWPAFSHNPPSTEPKPNRSWELHCWWIHVFECNGQHTSVRLKLRRRRYTCPGHSWSSISLCINSCTRVVPLTISVDGQWPAPGGGKCRRGNEWRSNYTMQPIVLSIRRSVLCSYAMIFPVTSWLSSRLLLILDSMLWLSLYTNRLANASQNMALSNNWRYICRVETVWWNLPI